MSEGIELAFDCHHISDSNSQDLGTLFIRKREGISKWLDRRQRGLAPVLSTQVKLPPIIIPSSGRAQSALLDLSQAMEKKKNFVQIVVVRDEEKFKYLKTALNHPTQDLDVFVMKTSKHEKPVIGEARNISKRLGEVIVRGTNLKFMFMMDDNVIYWNGVTLINDTLKMFGKDPSHKTSQRTDISLYQILNHFSSQSFGDKDNFSILGFSQVNRGINKRKNAYARKHVFAAVLLNLPKLIEIDYNDKAWAMEDVDFNMRTNECWEKNINDGVIVKCMRYVATKKFLAGGGVVANKNEIPSSEDDLEPISAPPSPTLSLQSVSRRSRSPSPMDVSLETELAETKTELAETKMELAEIKNKLAELEKEVGVLKGNADLDQGKIESILTYSNVNISSNIMLMQENIALKKAAEDKAKKVEEENNRRANAEKEMIKAHDMPIEMEKYPEKEGSSSRDMTSPHNQSLQGRSNVRSPPGIVMSTKRAAGHKIKKAKKFKDANAPKRPLSAFFLFSDVHRAKIKEQNPAFSIFDVSKELGKLWAEMDSNEKAKFKMEATEAKTKYDVEMSAYKTSKRGKTAATALRAATDGGNKKIKAPNVSKKVKKVARGNKQVKDPNAPKKPANSFFLFSKAHRAVVKEKNPRFGFSEVQKELGNMWDTASPTVKAKFEQEAAEAKAKYEEEKVAYNTAK